MGSSLEKVAHCSRLRWSRKLIISSILTFVERIHRFINVPWGPSCSQIMLIPCFEVGALTLDECFSAPQIVEELRSLSYRVNLFFLFSIVSCVIFEMLNSLQASLLLLLDGVVDIGLQEVIFDSGS